MAIAVAADARASAADLRASAIRRLAGTAQRAASALEAAPLTALPLVLGPASPSAAQALAVLGTMALFLLLDLAGACRADRRRALPFLFALAAGGLAAWLGSGLPLLALLFLPLKLCARAAWQGRSPAMAAALAAALAACRVDAGALAAGQASASWLLLAVGALAAFAALARKPAGTRPPGADVRVPTGRGQCRELALIALLAAGVAALLAVLGSDARIQAMGLVGAFLPAPFLLLGAFRGAQLALVSGHASRVSAVGDPSSAFATLGWAAALVIGPFLF